MQLCSLHLTPEFCSMLLKSVPPLYWWASSPAEIIDQDDQEWLKGELDLAEKKNVEKQLLGGRIFFDSLFESGLHSKILATGILLEVVQVAFGLSNAWWISQMQQLKRPTLEIFLHPTLATFARATAKRSLPDMLRTPSLAEDKTYTTLVQEQLTQCLHVPLMNQNGNLRHLQMALNNDWTSKIFTYRIRMEEHQIVDQIGSALSCGLSHPAGWALAWRLSNDVYTEHVEKNSYRAKNHQESI